MENAPPVKKTISFRKGALVKVKRQDYLSSLEVQASDEDLPEYIFQGPGEILLIKGDYCQIRWRRPVPDVWLRIDQLDTYSV